MKHTAVEWFSNESWKLKIQLENKEISIGEYAVTYVKLVDEAREMEQEQMIDWYATGQADTVNMYEQHLKKTSNTNEK